VTDWVAIAARLALYADLGLLFGLPLIMLCLIKEAERQSLRLGAIGIGLIIFGLVVSLFGFAQQVATMSGASLMAIDPDLARVLLTETALGWALIVRLVALIAALGLALFYPPRSARLWLLTLCGGIAAATLAWSGHGAASEGRAGMIHLASNIVHLLAASAWLGALVVLLLLVAPRGGASPDRVAAAHRALSAFSGIGTVLVGLIVLTGLVNGLFVVGAAHLLALGQSTYGQLLLIKLLLFGAMLGCAAANRFWLTPRLERARGSAGTSQALAVLRRTIALETVFALLVLALVAWFGTLEPPMAL
jgi:putative copper resistance protein D